MFTPNEAMAINFRSVYLRFSQEENNENNDLLIGHDVPALEEPSLWESKKEKRKYNEE